MGCAKKYPLKPAPKTEANVSQITPFPEAMQFLVVSTVSESGVLGVIVVPTFATHRFHDGLFTRRGLSMEFSYFVQSYRLCSQKCGLPQNVTGTLKRHLNM